MGARKFGNAVPNSEAGTAAKLAALEALLVAKGVLAEDEVSAARVTGAAPKSGATRQSKKG